MDFDKNKDELDKQQIYPSNMLWLTGYVRSLARGRGIMWYLQTLIQLPPGEAIQTLAKSSLTFAAFTPKPL